MSIRVVMWAEWRMAMRASRERVPWPIVEIVCWGGEGFGAGSGGEGEGVDDGEERRCLE